MVDKKISITVKPNSKKGPLVEVKPDGSLIVYIREIAADGQANDALIKLLSKHFKVVKTKITIVRGHTSKHKIVSIV
ncbi:hypothetical protein COV88_02140 [Candidatus Saccharibacteria bacterium CG11_big_fil_rev_8_21_14_0_20_41_19]|nr:DUF167 domain-containing protein [Candidatus Saccharibacteria bacterium]OIP85808.1 MAG: hypothetical protein AUK57_03050 [Candidatus Saccharibacteria bacterium CG2_30_41_52]PIQ70923.1 MAG: hypothetical protein COV88_02140 [Candidatus Saccharibacteria bacterium CG11_big_fil_rev_8_21_14_0_20_41_19]PIZ61163.1 MAG: hypothetical protein COY18_00065 [Candidatus Saccharibacteria bacterium CG_4_10_14_0_2_um_filter_41_11]PJC29981.1 MAG: hypothetical protein CO052_00460 [Candidatus Saccharibacteria ba